MIDIDDYATPLPIHVWHRCHNCDAEPIVGGRYDCKSCPAGPDNHLCEACYALYIRGAVKHPLPNSYAACLNIDAHEFARVHVARENCDTWLRFPDSTVNAPPISDRFVVRLECCVKRESFFGGYGSIIQDDDTKGPLVVTALHVMDELSRSVKIDCSLTNENYDGAELPRVVDQVNIYDAFAPKWMLAKLGAAGRMLVLPDARIGEVEPYCQLDLAAFLAPSFTSLSTARLALSAPEEGEPLWLAAATTQNHSIRAIPAVVVERSVRALIFRFDGRSGQPPPYASGAPLVNRLGEVVGVNLGAGFLKGRRYGYGIHADSIRRHLTTRPHRPNESPFE